VDDTAPGIGEGKAAGTWTVGVALSGNVTGLSAEELAALPAERLPALRDRARRELGAADFIIDSVADLPAVVAEVDTRLAAGWKPGT
jgi:phosphonoacetaldehyde hydrolase